MAEGMRSTRKNTSVNSPWNPLFVCLSGRLLDVRVEFPAFLKFAASLPSSFAHNRSAGPSAVDQRVTTFVSEFASIILYGGRDLLLSHALTFQNPPLAPLSFSSHVLPPRSLFLSLSFTVHVSCALPCAPVGVAFSEF